MKDLSFDDRAVGLVARDVAAVDVSLWCRLEPAEVALDVEARGVTPPCEDLCEVGVEVPVELSSLSV